MRGLNFAPSKFYMFQSLHDTKFQDPNFSRSKSCTILILHDLDYTGSKFCISKYCKIELLWYLNNINNTSKSFTKTLLFEADKFVKTDCVPRMPRHCKNGNYIRAQRFIITVFHRSYYCQKLLEIQSCIERLKLWALRCARHNGMKLFRYTVS